MKALSKIKLYVKLPDYVAAYLRHNYGGSVLSFSPDTIFYYLMRKSITKNQMLQNPLSPSCWSQKAVEYVKKNGTALLNSLRDIHLPCVDDVEKLQAVYMPAMVGTTSMWEPNDSCQMNRQGTLDFLGAAKQEFWNELFSYIHDNKYKRTNNGKIIAGSRRSDPNLISEFMTKNNIDAAMFPAVRRRYYAKLCNVYSAENE